jgi:hypothetical protein
MQNHSYPTLVDYLKRKEFQDMVDQYSNLTAAEFLKMIPDPKSTFLGERRQAASGVYKENVSLLVRALFPNVDEDIVQEALTQSRNCLLPCMNYLGALGCERGPFPSYGIFPANKPLDLVFMQEVHSLI